MVARLYLLLKVNESKTNVIAGNCSATLENLHRHSGLKEKRGDEIHKCKLSKKTKKHSATLNTKYNMCIVPLIKRKNIASKRMTALPCPKY